MYAMIPLDFLFDHSLLTQPFRNFAEKRALPLYIYTTDSFQNGGNFEG